MHMIFMKIIGAVLIVGSGIYLSGNITMAMKRRLQELYALKTLMVLLEGDISYSISTLPECFLEISEKVDSPFDEWLHSLGNQLLNYEVGGFESIFQASIQTLKRDSYLRQEDMELILNLSGLLGFLDKDMQCNLVKLTRSRIEETIVQVEKGMKNQTKIIHTVGVLIGILIVIILI